MKAGKDHRVPLSPQAVEILDRLPGERDPDRRLFPVLAMALLRLVRKVGGDGLTVHGFRSAFRDWAAEETDFPNEVAEMALAHAIGSKVEAAYRRGDLFGKRREMMEAWEKWCG